MKNTEKNTISIVIGSWGSYNACNSRALGSKWLNLSDYASWEDIEKELKKQGFILDGIDEELFIQDIENFPIENADYTHPKELFELLQISGILKNEYKYTVAMAVIEVMGYEELMRRIKDNDEDWDCDIALYTDINNATDLGYYYIHELEYLQVPEYLENYIDYEQYGRDLLFDSIYLTSYGALDIR